MNRVLQPDVHPDAESLNAFVERALSQPERAQIVAHLGGCARCREVVFLAQAAAEADAAPVAAVTTKSPETASGRTWWRAAFANWRMALIPAAALATAAGILIWVQMKPVPPAATLAQVAPPPPSSVPSFAARSVPGPAEPAATSAAPPAAVRHIPPKAARAEQKIAQSPDKKILPVPPVAASKEPAGSGADENLPLTARQSDAQKPVITPAVPAAFASRNADWDSEAAVKAKQAAMAQRDGAMNAQIKSSEAIAAPPPPAPAPPNIVAVHGSLMSPATAGPLAIGAAASRQAELMPQPVNGLAALRLAGHLRLPSGLNAVSSAVMLDRILAVDSEGVVFLSRDATKHWERVPVQWTGKAIAVQAPPRELHPLNAAAQNDPNVHTSPVASVSINPAPPAPAPVAPPAPVEPIKQAQSAADAPGPPPAPASADAALPIPGMLFKLINDHHQVWVSADGKVWHEQQESE